MDGQTIMLYIILATIFAAMIVGIFFDTRARHNKRKEGTAPAQPVQEPVIDESEPQEKAVEARVVEKKLEQSYAGVRVSTNVVEYVVIFRTEDPETLTFSVPQDIFESLREGDTGMLITVNGNFFYFGEGEDVDGGNA